MGRSGRPGAVVAAEYPEDAAVGVGIAAVEGVFVVEMNHDASGFLRRFGPFEDFFAPEHAEVVVDAAFAEELGLRGVPEGIVGLGAFELLERVEMGTFIAGVGVEGFLHPGWERFELIIVVAMGCEVVADFAPGDDLIEKGFGGGGHVPPAFAAAVGAKR